MEFYELRREVVTNLEHQLTLRDKVWPDMQKWIDRYTERLYMILESLWEVDMIPEKSYNDLFFKN